jgi:hypothetical protein
VQTRKPTWDRVLYRQGLSCCPPAFRREYADEMLRDFDDARDDAVAVGRRHLWIWRALILFDLVRTILSQWWLSGWPAIAVVSAALPIVMAGSIAGVFRRTVFSVPLDVPHADTLGLVLLTTVFVVVIATTILFTTWVSFSVRRRQRPGCSKRGL